MSQGRKLLSIRGLTWRYLTVILLSALVGIILTTAVAVYTSNEAVKQHEEFELSTLSKDISGMLDFYHKLVARFAGHQDVIDILSFADVDKAIEWSKEVRYLLPESIGVALIDERGMVLGDPLTLNLGSSCVEDMQRLISGEDVSTPPVHRENPSLVHFDITVPVHDHNREVMGLLFMSFSTEIIQRRIEHLSSRKDYLQITDHNGYPIASLGRSGSEYRGQLYSNTIPGTDWILRYQGRGWEGSRLYSVSMLIGAMVFVITVTLALFLSSRLVRFFQGDLTQIKGLLMRIDSEGKELQPPAVMLKETDSILQDVSVLVNDIDLANRQLKLLSTHDELTGLFNRRAFEQALLHYARLANRGVKSWLVLLDLDHFKQINDSYGHGVGDEVLNCLGDALRERCRSSDILARLGGDEFALILPGDIEFGMQQWYDDIDKCLIACQGAVNGGTGVQTPSHISAGALVIKQGYDDDPKALLNMADRYLYQAKGQGRGRIVIGSE